MNLINPFNLQCSTTSDNIALTEADRQISYRRLKQQCVNVSTYLQSHYPNCQRVVIALDRGIDATIAIIAALGTGASYIPLDLQNPDARKQYIIKDADPHCIIGKGHCPEWLNEKNLWLDIDAIPQLHTDSDWPVQLQSSSIAAILYTSGSTGNPKGVALSHKAMQNFSNWAKQTFQVSSHDKIASLAPIYFDLSVFDLFTGLGAGASVYFVPKTLTLSPSRLTQWLSKQQITLWYTVPSLLSFITLKGALAQTNLKALRALLFAGEVFPTQYLIKLSECLPNVELYNLFGPTETNVCCYWPVQRDSLDPACPIPIGHAAGDAQLKIDADSSELWVKSDNNLSGYWKEGTLQPVKTLDGFFPTGDKVSINKNGEYLYHGRLDRMIKCSGYRIEPAEIENQIINTQQVSFCAVVGIKDSTSGQRPAAALVMKPNCTLNRVIQTIKQQLPAYMQPVKFITTNQLPYLANGKIDYRSIQKQLEQS